MKLKEKKFIEDLINKMFKIAGHSVTYNDIKDRKDDWYTEWTMTMKQNEEWRNWGISEMKKRFNYNKVLAEKEMDWISLMWGLKFNDFK